MNWKEGLVRGARTFFQTFAGALAGMSITDVLSKTVAISVGMKLLGALLASAIAGLGAFATNLGTPTTTVVVNNPAPPQV
jgi:hypothetical protein